MNAKCMLLCLAIAIGIMAFGLVQVESVHGGATKKKADYDAEAAIYQYIGPGPFNKKGENVLSSARSDDFEVDGANSRGSKSPGRSEFFFVPSERLRLMKLYEGGLDFSLFPEDFGDGVYRGM
jgi:hypothetical protein